MNTVRGRPTLNLLRPYVALGDVYLLCVNRHDDVTGGRSLRPHINQESEL